MIRVLDEGPRTAFRLPDGQPRLLGTANAPSASAQSYPPKGRVALYEIGLTDVRLDRLAQLPTDWAKQELRREHARARPQGQDRPVHRPGRSSQPAAARAAREADDGADIHLTGELNNYWDRPYDGSWNLKLDAKNLGPTIHTCIKRRGQRRQPQRHDHADRPVRRVAESRLRSRERRLRRVALRRAGAAAAHARRGPRRDRLVNEQGYIEKTKALIRNGKEPGEVELSATFGLSPYNANAQVDIVKPIDVARFMPEKARVVAQFLKGHLSARGDNAVETADAPTGFVLEDFDLSLGPTPTSTSIRVHGGRVFTPNNFASVQIQNVAIDARQSHILINGVYDTVAQEAKNLVIEGTFPDLGSGSSCSACRRS